MHLSLSDTMSVLSVNNLHKFYSTYMLTCDLMLVLIPYDALNTTLCYDYHIFTVEFFPLVFCTIYLEQYFNVTVIV